MTLSHWAGLLSLGGSFFDPSIPLGSFCDICHTWSRNCTSDQCIELITVVIAKVKFRLTWFLQAQGGSFAVGGHRKWVDYSQWFQLKNPSWQSRYQQWPRCWQLEKWRPNLQNTALASWTEKLVRKISERSESLAPFYLCNESSIVRGSLCVWVFGCFGGGLNGVPIRVPNEGLDRVLSGPKPDNRTLLNWIIATGYKWGLAPYNFRLSLNLRSKSSILRHNED